MGGIFASSSVILFGVQTMQSDTKQNIVTWILWFVMDVILAVTSYVGEKKKSVVERRRVNVPWLPIGFTAGAFFMVVALVLKGTWQFGLVEIVSVAGITIALFVWMKVGPTASVVVSVVASIVAGIPAVYTAIISPAPETGWFWGACAFSGILTFAATEKWTIEQRLFPISTFFLNLGMAALMIR